ncbi:unnamed protein product [Anisakis simplex]|uniref:Uncharacterized protein n=1 Tax=Anisakis simplex TaxID=6269 RepID=A0A0M3K281_ANISI|nr:unnamed protein product [Anisakis simplex]
MAEDEVKLVDNVVGFFEVAEEVALECVDCVRGVVGVTVIVVKLFVVIEEVSLVGVFVVCTAEVTVVVVESVGDDVEVTVVVVESVGDVVEVTVVVVELIEMVEEVV